VTRCEERADKVGCGASGSWSFPCKLPPYPFHTPTSSPVMSSSMDEKRGAHETPAFEEEDISNTLASGGISELVVVAEGEERTTLFVWLLVLCSSISGLLFGRLFLPLIELIISKAPVFKAMIPVSSRVLL
jgi:hypothetical protein